MSTPTTNGPVTATTAATAASPSRHRLLGAGAEGSQHQEYLRKHSIVELLNEMLSAVVAAKPQDELAFLVDFCEKISAEVDAAVRASEAAAARGGGARQSVREMLADQSNNNTNVNNAATATTVVVTANTSTATSNNKAGANPATGATALKAPSPQRTTTSYVEVLVDGERRLIPELGSSMTTRDDDDDHHDKNQKDANVTAAAAAVTANNKDDRRQQQDNRTTTGPFSSSTNNSNAPSVPLIVVQDPTPLRLLLKAAERQKTPFLSALVDLGRARAAALRSADIQNPLMPLSSRQQHHDEQQQQKSSAEIQSTASPTTTNPKDGASSGAASRQQSLKSKDRDVSAAISNMGLELLQRSSAGDAFPVLSLLNNHWMVRRQIVFTIGQHQTQHQQQTQCHLSQQRDETGADAQNADNKEEEEDPSADKALHSDGDFAENGDNNNNNNNGDHGNSNNSKLINKKTTTSTVPTNNNNNSSSSGTSGGGGSGGSATHRHLFVQDPWPIRLLLKAADRQETPAWSMLVSFARMKYTALNAATIAGNTTSTSTAAAAAAGGGGVAPASSYPSNHPPQQLLLNAGNTLNMGASTTSQINASFNINSSNPSAGPSRTSSSIALLSTGGGGASSTTTAIIPMQILGIELLQRSCGRDGFPVLSLLNNHWMVRRQIIVAVKPPSQSQQQNE